MDLLERSGLERLSGVRNGPCVSIYLPTHPVGPESTQDTIRLKNQLQAAERKLSGDWLRAPEARSWLARAASLPNDAIWWPQRDRGLAIFIAEGFFEGYRLPLPLPELVVVADRFRIRPLLPLLHGRTPFHILELSQKQVRLYRADEHSIERLDVPMPDDIGHALNYEVPDRGAQVHSALKASGGKQAAVFHGQGGRPDTAQNELVTYFRLVDKAVTSGLGPTVTPLLLACVDYLAPVYRKVNTHAHLLSKTLSGNQDHESVQTLRRRAWELVGDELAKTAVGHAVDRFQDGAGSEKTTHDIRTVVSAASEGRVDTLLCDPRANVLGVHRADLSTAEITGRETDEDLIDLAAAETLRHGGDVYSVVGHELPTNSPLAAILRY